MIFHKNHPADDSHEKSYLIFFGKFGKMLKNLSSAAVFIGTLSVNDNCHLLSRLLTCMYFGCTMKAFRFMVGPGHCPMISKYGPSLSKAVGHVNPSFLVVKKPTLIKTIHLTASLGTPQNRKYMYVVNTIKHVLSSQPKKTKLRIFLNNKWQLN